MRTTLQKKQCGAQTDPCAKFKANGGLPVIWAWYNEEVLPTFNMTRRQLEEEQLRLRPYEEPKWRANIDKRRFSEVKLLCEYIEARALEHQKATGRVWSRPQMARQLENERRTAGQGGKEQGLTSLVKQLQKQRKEASKRADETAAALEAAPEGEQEGS